mmetsp:Transcript_119467/g.283589  ORF Transcript_119467/g.283589 Transcript_119467/m.283589 type:complete len:666 (-) Transcript_119467:52-2049(-)
MSLAGSASGQKLRLNVVALTGGGTEEKLLVCIDEEATVEDLTSKIASVLAKARIEGRLLRLTNTKNAHLRDEDRVGDALRDGEDVLAVLTQQLEDPAARRDGVGAPVGVTATAGSGSFAKVPRYAMQEAEAAALGAVPKEVVGPTAPVSVMSGVAAPAEFLPGPVEAFEEDWKVPASRTGVSQEASPKRPRCDWEVEQLTHKLREYVVARFREMHEMPADPGSSYIIVSLRPREQPGSVVSPLPLHYSVARVDIIEFERLARRKVQECRMRLDFFRRCLEALNSLLDRGAGREAYVPNMLPYSYRQDEEFGSLLEEVDEGTFGQAEGFRPVIVLDTSGPLGQHLVFVKAAIKRLMYSFIVAKSRFNIITFNSSGKAVSWEDHLVPPVAQKLKEAESFIDIAQPCFQTDLLEAMRWAVQSCDADMVYLLTSGFCKKTDVEYCRADIRSRNLRQLPIHVIGVQCEVRAEVDLRRLAEENRGSFRHKSFRSKTSISKCFAQLLSSRRTSAPKKALGKAAQCLSVGGQIDILEVLVKEQEVQITDWLEEQKCSNRILLSTTSQLPVPDARQARFAAGQLVVNQLCRSAPPPLRELLQGRRPRSRTCYGCSPRTEKWASDDGARRPAVQNPWDRPSGVVKVSEVASCEKGIHPARAALYRNPGPGYEFAR